MVPQPAPRPARRGGRGARERILRTAERLFHTEGINATGMERLTEAAEVSRRTFYQHFPSKNALVEEYLHRLDADLVPHERVLRRDDLPPRDRLLALFTADPTCDGGAGDTARPGRVRVRGCPFHNAAVETAGTLPAVEQAVIRHKEAFTDLLTDTARAAGAVDPPALGRQLAVLFEGATALATSLNDLAPLADARAAATILIDAALHRPPAGRRRTS
ncbi:TetR family transcriptional regulator [Parafrankia colletiae]|uniref:TetR family transcriptional regulator n=1 Tax=Parafrankia colletiae TaxID=573497 RepID=A0A1S1QWH1_9ACTN|nr:TetR family transcriptional regulator [Parafrankia colletiae]